MLEIHGIVWCRCHAADDGGHADAHAADAHVADADSGAAVDGHADGTVLQSAGAVVVMTSVGYDGAAVDAPGAHDGDAGISAAADRPRELYDPGADAVADGVGCDGVDSAGGDAVTGDAALIGCSAQAG